MYRHGPAQNYVYYSKKTQNGDNIKLISVYDNDKL